jgi:hypothetical protein
MIAVVDASVAVTWVIPEHLGDHAPPLITADRRLLARVARRRSPAVVDLAHL